MSFKDQAGMKSGVSGACGASKFADKPGDLEEALGDFRLSVHAWSQAVLSRPRRAVATGRRRGWRLAAGWALASVLLAGGLSGKIWEHHRQAMRIAAARVAEQQRLAAQVPARPRQAEEDLLARVDSDISRTVPSAMEPLAQLMAGDQSQ